jgi:flagellar hook-associated protein 2
MATISSLGIASGIDSNSIVSQLVALEKIPLTALQMQATVDNAQITAFGQMQSEFSALADAANAMVPATAWQAKTASSSNTSAATITADTTANATSFSLDVDALAKGQSVASGQITSGGYVGSGTLTIQLGTWTPASGSTSAAFAANSTQPAISVAVTGTDTVATIASKINAANTGVVATAFNDGTHDRLLLSSASTGVSNGFTVTATDSNNAPITDGTGLSQLAFDPTQSSDPNSGAYGMAAAGNPVQYAQNASARINGLTVTSTTNTLTNNVPGVTINLLATTTTGLGTASQVNNSVSMAVSQDVTGVVQNVSAFVTAYNTLATDLASSTAYDPSTNTASLFQADGSILGLQSILRSMVGSVSSGSSAYQRLSDVGIQVQTDGTLAIDTTTLAAAANNGTEMQKLFTTNTNNAGTEGFALKFGNFASGALVAGGLVATKATALAAVLAQNTADQTSITDKATAVETRLKAQYSALDGQMASLNALSSYVSQQITTWNKSTS